MSDHLTEAQLHACAEGVVDHHLDACAACRAEVEGLRALLREAATLPKAIEPTRDLWPGIAPRLRRARRPALPVWLLAAAAIAGLVIAGALWLRPTGTAWEGITASRMTVPATLRPGDILETPESSWVRLRVGRIGAVQIAGGSRIRLLASRRGEQRLALDRGTLSARILAKPRVFVVETPSATAVDLGCAYTLTVDSAGNGLLHVTSGWVEFTWQGRSTIVPRDAYAATRRGFGPGTAYAADAPLALREALAAFDFGGGGEAAVRAALAAARPADAPSLLNLLPRVSGPLRGAVYDRLAALAPPPSQVTRDGIVQLDQTMLNRWWDRVAPPRIEKFDPENFGPAPVTGGAGQ